VTEGKKSAPDADPMIGKTVANRFEILSVLGEGGMGKVYLCKDKETGGQAALKLVLGKLTGNEEFVQRLKQEARTAGRLRHDGAVRILASGETETGAPYLAMEFCPGQTLKELIHREKHLDVPRACNIVAQLVDAVGAAHKQGIIHRDLKPENIKIAPDALRGESVKVLDFGVAKFVGGDAPEMENAVKTKTGIILGTPKYMAPEQIRGDQIDGRSDLYSCGAILYELLSGDPPFRADDVFGYVTAHLKEPVIPLTERVPEYAIPREVDDLVLWMLEKNPQQRPKDASQITTVLERHSHGSSGARIKFLSRVAGAWVLPAIAAAVLLLVMVPTGLNVSVPAKVNGEDTLKTMVYGMELVRLHGLLAAVGLALGGGLGVYLVPRMSVSNYLKRLSIAGGFIAACQLIALALGGAGFAAAGFTVTALMVFAGFSLAWPMESPAMRVVWAGVVAPVVAAICNPVPLRMYEVGALATDPLPTEFYLPVWDGLLWQQGLGLSSVGPVALLSIFAMGLFFGLGTLFLPKPGRGNAS
jgi:hypothetical protein